MDENGDTGKIPNQKELEKELSDYLSKKYGNRIKIISPFVFPKGQEVSTDEGKAGDEEKEAAPSFEMLPEELEAYLESFIIKQEQAKAVLATKVCTHFNRINYLNKNSGKNKTVGIGMIKNNVLMIGPTGVGKTYIIKLIAQKLGVPFVKGDATKFSETGYVGGDVEDLVRDLVYEANDDIELAESGIIYIDEIDKIASARNIIGHDVSRTGVQRALLKPMEETEVDLKVPHDAVSQIQAIEHYRRTGKKEKRLVNTKNILFIMSGAFGDLAEIIKKRLQRQGIGFEADVRPSEVPWEILKEVRAQDLIQEILKNPNNPIILSKRQDFKAYDIDIKFEDGALIKIAEMAAREKTGARGLVSAAEKVLIPFEKHLPSTTIRQLLVTAEVVDNPEAELLSLKQNPDDSERLERFEKAAKEEIENIKQFIANTVGDFHQLSSLEIYDKRIELMAELYLTRNSDINTAVEDFRTMYNQIKKEEASLYDKLEITISFDDSAIDELIKIAMEMGQEADSLTFQLAKKLEYGLKLVRDRSGVDSFNITAEAITDMEKYINKLVKKYYRHDYDILSENLENE
jgi:ATP-dependent protease Clp ATPase subunit